MRYAESHRNKLKHARDALNDMLVPTSIKANFRCLSKEAERQLSESITKNYLSSNYFPSGYAETEVGRNDLSDHLYVRLREHRSTIIPWLNTLRPLKGSEILEIGCGTGTSTVALAEQGARVTAVEVDARSLRVAKERCHLYGLETVTFHDMNAQDVGRQPLDNFD
jgi:2-polyprenyl-3-methyl-5-hydroxy-6-metoxy-1,4-benzoquinol methylase